MFGTIGCDSVPPQPVGPEVKDFWSLLPRGVLKLYLKEGQKTGLKFPGNPLHYGHCSMFLSSPLTSWGMILMGLRPLSCSAWFWIWAQGGLCVVPGSPAPWQTASRSPLHLRTLPSNFINLLMVFLVFKNGRTWFQLVLIDIIPAMFLLGQQFPLMNIQHCVSASSQMW